MNLRRASVCCTKDRVLHREVTARSTDPAPLPSEERSKISVEGETASSSDAPLRHTFQSLYFVLDSASSPVTYRPGASRHDWQSYSTDLFASCKQSTPRRPPPSCLRFLAGSSVGPRMVNPPPRALPLPHIPPHRRPLLPLLGLRHTRHPLKSASMSRKHPLRIILVHPSTSTIFPLAQPA